VAALLKVGEAAAGSAAGRGKGSFFANVAAVRQPNGLLARLGFGDDVDASIP
jgi:hypothetical protein